MKAILEFDLNEPLERKEHLRCSKAIDMSIVLWDITQYLRNEMKYNNNITECEYDILEKVSNQIHEIIDDYELNNIVND